MERRESLGAKRGVRGAAGDAARAGRETEIGATCTEIEGGCMEEVRCDGACLFRRVETSITPRIT